MLSKACEPLRLGGLALERRLPGSTLEQLAWVQHSQMCGCVYGPGPFTIIEQTQIISIHAEFSIPHSTRRRKS